MKRKGRLPRVGALGRGNYRARGREETFEGAQPQDAVGVSEVLGECRT